MAKTAVKAIIFQNFIITLVTNYGRAAFEVSRYYLVNERSSDMANASPWSKSELSEAITTQ